MTTRIYKQGTLMTPRRTTIGGFDYHEGKPVERTRQEWREQLQRIVAQGGFTRVEHGETYGHRKGARIEVEIYGYVK
jgi:hypothetical protein